MRVLSPIHSITPIDAHDQLALPFSVLEFPLFALACIFSPFGAGLWLIGNKVVEEVTQLRNEQLESITSQEGLLPATGTLRSQAVVRTGPQGVLNLIQLDDTTIRFLGPKPDARQAAGQGEGYREYPLTSLRKITEDDRPSHVPYGMKFIFKFRGDVLEECDIQHATEWREAFKKNALTRAKLDTRY